MKKHTKIYIGLTLITVATIALFFKFNKPEKPVQTLVFDEAYPFSEDLACVKINGRYGYIDKTGEVVIKPKYDTIGYFHSGFSLQIKNNLYGVIDKSGKVIIPFEYQELSTGTEKYIAARKNGKYGCIDFNNEVIIDFTSPMPIQLIDYSEDHTIAIIYGESMSQGIVDIKTGYKSPVIYSSIEPWSNISNTVATYSGSKYGFINLDTQTEIEPQFLNSLSFNDNLAAATSDNVKYGYIDITGDYVIEPIYDEAYPFSDGLAFVKTNDKFGCINTKGEMVFEPQFSGTGFFYNGVAEISSFSNVNESIYINTAGEEITMEEYYKTINHYYLEFQPDLKIIPTYYYHESLGHCAMAVTPSGEILFKTVYDNISPFQYNMAVVMDNNKYGCINEKGIEILPPIYDTLIPVDENTIIVSEKGKFGLIDTMRNEILPFKYSAMDITHNYNFMNMTHEYNSLDMTTNNLIMLKLKDKWGYYNLETKELKEDLYDDTILYSSFPMPVKKNEKWFYIDENGESLFQN